MRITDTHAEVVIIGAGPSGLMMAAQLLRNGIQPLIIDSKQGPTTHSKALAVQARSVEIYRQMGLAQKMLPDSTFAKGVKFYQDGELTAQLNLGDAGFGQTPYPYVYLYEQNKTERLLLDELTRLCCPVYWNTTLTGLQMAASGNTLQLQTGEESYTLTCNWLVGADGAHSTVRHALQIPFEGDTYAHEFFLADISLNNKELTHEEMQLYLSSEGFAAFFPEPQDSAFRIVGSIPPDISKENLQLDDVRDNLKALTGFELQDTECRWFTTYRLHHRMAQRFSANRCFLIGDAAHIHSPVGGQGMNTGLQDAYNLAWKLAGVITGQFKPEIVNTFATERQAVANDLLRSTDRVFSLITSKKITARLFKKWVLPRILNLAWKNAAVRRAFFARISQTHINYRNSRLSLHLSHAHTIKAGDRLPYLKIFDEKKKQETDLQAWCSKPGFTLITFGLLSEQEIFSLAKWITYAWGRRLNFFHLPPSASNQPVFDKLEVKEVQLKTLIIRPDMHIGLTADGVDREIIGNYLTNIAGIIRQ